MSKAQWLFMVLAFGLMIVLTVATAANAGKNTVATPVVRPEVLQELSIVVSSFKTMQDNQIALTRETMKQHDLDKQTNAVLANHILDLTQEIKTLKSEVMKGISLIPTTLRNEKPQPDAEKMAVIKVINDKLTVVATNAATKEDLEKLKTSVMQVLEEDKARKAENPVVAPVATPSIVLPSLSEEFPKK